MEPSFYLLAAVGIVVLIAMASIGSDTETSISARANRGIRISKTSHITRHADRLTDKELEILLAITSQIVFISTEINRYDIMTSSYPGDSYYRDEDIDAAQSRKDLYTHISRSVLTLYEMIGMNSESLSAVYSDIDSAMTTLSKSLSHARSKDTYELSAMIKRNMAEKG